MCNFTTIFMRIMFDPYDTLRYFRILKNQMALKKIVMLCTKWCKVLPHCLKS